MKEHTHDPNTCSLAIVPMPARAIIAFKTDQQPIILLLRLLSMAYQFTWMIGVVGVSNQLPAPSMQGLALICTASSTSKAIQGQAWGP